MSDPCKIRVKKPPSAEAQAAPRSCRHLRTGEEISGARFHRAEHVGNMLHVRATTVILAPALSNLFHCKIVQLDGRTLLEEVDGHQQVVLPPPLQDQTLDASQGSILNPHLRSRL